MKGRPEIRLTPWHRGAWGGNRYQTTKSLEQLRPPRPNLPSGRCTSYCRRCFRASGRLLLADCDPRVRVTPPYAMLVIQAIARSNAASATRSATEAKPIQAYLHVDIVTKVDALVLAAVLSWSRLSNPPMRP